MPTFITLINWTDQGIRNVKQTIERAEAVKGLAQKVGATVKEIYWTQGPYDAVTIIEAPDAETVSALSLSAASLGNVRTQTLRHIRRKKCGVSWPGCRRG